MRYTRFIATIVALMFATSCFVEDIDQPMASANGGDKITVIGRVSRFADRDIATRGTKNEDEAKVTCMAIALFPVDTVAGTIGPCAHYEFKEGNQLLFTITRTQQDENGYIFKTDHPYTMYVFANMPAMTAERCANMTLDEMKAEAAEVKNVNVVTNGFPMLGSLGDYKAGGGTCTPEGDGNKFILKPGSESNPTLPLVNGKETDLLNIPMKAMYAKINFTIKVTPDQTIEGKYAPQFVLDDYTVHNVSNSVDFAKGNDSATAVIEGSFKNPLPLTSASNVARGANTVNFTFYLPERYLTPTYQAHDGSKDGQTGYYDYPLPVVNGKYRDEDLDLRQRFKPLLPKGQAATYVTLSGTFRDHQNHEYAVTYDIYLGNDNFGNFDTERNCEYQHYVTIRGILNSDDQVAYDPTTQMPVSIDHRVDVTRVEPIIINLRRETLLDSHFEVRPLRIRKNPAYKGTLSNAKVKVEVIYDKEPDQKWIGLERSFGNGAQSGSATYLGTNDLATDRQNSLGKRKYFTYDLTYNTLKGESQKDTNGYSTSGGQSVIVPITETDEAVWIYVDEALVAEAGDALRTATIRVSVAEDGKNYGTPIDYIIQQRQLFPVTYGDHTYLIEYEEEYLHNFDASDSYGQTEDNGMPWGLNGVQLSHQHKSYVATGTLGDIMNLWLGDFAMHYDFYLTRDITNDKLTRRDNAGDDFTSEIIAYVPDLFTPITMADKPRSAIEYCYNRNKRNADGSVASVNWYLPAIDEIENIMKSSYSDFLVFQNKPYWSCQPAFHLGVAWYHSYAFSNIQSMDYYKDDLTSARATKIVYNSTTKSHDNISSGVTGYEYLFELYEPLFGSDYHDEVVVTSNNFTYTSPQRGSHSKTISTKTDKTNHAGNVLRTSKARVRCVRKAD